MGTVKLTREVRFSVDRDWVGRLDPARPVTNSWAGWPSAVGLVPYLRLRVTIAGKPDLETGYLCNIQTLDAIVRQRAIPYVAQRLSDKGWLMSAEQLLVCIWERIAPAIPQNAKLECLVLNATPFLRYAVWRKDPTMVQVTQQFEFSAAHRLHCENLSDEQNLAHFGKCNNPHAHGHNYIVEVSLMNDGDIGLPLPKFEQIVCERVIDRFDHKHLNIEVPEFQNVNPTVENIAKVVWQMLDGQVSPATLCNVRVYETPKTWADYDGD